jgi:hypothetical protein
VAADALAAAPARIVVTGPMKSGSTYVADLLRRYLGAERSNHDVRDYDWLAEHNLTDAFVAQMRGTSFSVNLHVLPHASNLAAFARESIVPVVLWRNLADVIVSFDDHVRGESHLNPVFHLADRDAYLALPPHERYAYLIDAIVPWNLSFYLAWRRRNAVMHAYEQLAASPAVFVREILAELGAAVDDERLADAITVRDGVRFNVGRAGRAAGAFSPANRRRLEEIVRTHPQRGELEILLWELPWETEGLRTAGAPYDGRVIADGAAAYFVSGGTCRPAGETWLRSRAPRFRRTERVPDGTAATLPPGPPLP